MATDHRPMSLTSPAEGGDVDPGPRRQAFVAIRLAVTAAEVDTEERANLGSVHAVPDAVTIPGVFLAVFARPTVAIIPATAASGGLYERRRGQQPPGPQGHGGRAPPYPPQEAPPRHPALAHQALGQFRQPLQHDQ